MKKEKLYSPANEIFTIVNGVLNLNKSPFTSEEKKRLKSEALTFKTMLLYQLLTTKVCNDIQKEIVENARTLEDLNYYRAVLADRRILIEEIESLINTQVSNTIDIKK